MGEGFFTDACKKFLHDQEAMSLFMHTKKLSEVDLAAFDALYLSGGHGCCTDFAANADVKAAIETMYASKLVAADCHGPIALAQCAKPDGTPLVAGLEVTGFSDVEEGQVGQTGQRALPHRVEVQGARRELRLRRAVDLEDGGRGQAPHRPEPAVVRGARRARREDARLERPVVCVCVCVSLRAEQLNIRPQESLAGRSARELTCAGCASSGMCVWLCS